MTLSEELNWRGLIKDKTFAEDTWLDSPKCFYLGVDVGSADSLTIGNLAVLLLARRLCDAGWQTVLLMGGATSLIGDPGGKTNERELVSSEQVEHNKACIRKQVETLFLGKQYKIVDNYDWLKDLGYLEFLRDVGKHYSLTELIQRDFISSRIGESGAGISYAEFSYSLLQGYDFWHLNKEFGAVLQVGGSDQWGNMISGVPLVRKKETQEVHAMSMPLVVDKTTGRKFGKSEAGAIWLDAAKTSPYKFYQFWLNVEDENVIDYLKIYTFLSAEQISELGQQLEHSAHERAAQKSLAYEVTKIVHGPDVAESVRRISATLFGGQEYRELLAEDFVSLKQELPVTQAIVGQTQLVEILVKTGLAQSNSEARRFLSEGAVYVNGFQFSMDKNVLDTQDVINGHVIIRRGKNSNAIIEVQS